MFALSRYLFCTMGLLVLIGCDQSPPEQVEAPIRGLVTTVVRESAETRERRYPGVLQPGEVNMLSFEVAGKLGSVELSVGQRVQAGQVLASLDSEQFETTIQERQASVDEAAATLKQDRDDLSRQETLARRGTVSRVSVDDARADFKRSQARVTQAQKALTAAKEDLKDTVLSAPFDGIINAVEAESFATVGAGEPVLSVYREERFEVAFPVSFEVVAALKVGAPARVLLADDPSTILAAQVTEVGERAETVSSFPIVVELTEIAAQIKPGMAVEVLFDFELPGARGFLIPIGAAIPEGEIPERKGPDTPQPIGIYVYDAPTGTVKRRTVLFAGLRENQFLVIEGLTEGEHVAVAGVTYLREGMKVRLLEPRN